jgi:hypothetical protein
MATETTKPADSGKDSAAANAQAQLAKLQQEKQELAEMLAEANARNAQLAATKGNKNPTCTHEGNTYQTNGPIRWKQQVLKPEQYVHMPEVIAHLVKTGSDRITRIS